MMAARRVLVSSLLRHQPRAASLPSSQLLCTPAIRHMPLRPAVRTTPAASICRAYSQTADSKIWDFEEIQRLIKEPDSNVVLVDAREPGELKATGHIPHAVNIPITTSPDSFHITDEEFEDKFGYPRPSKDTEVVFYCKAGVRSRAAATLARDAGWKSVGEYPGSWTDWEARGGEVER